MDVAVNIWWPTTAVGTDASQNFQIAGQLTVNGASALYGIVTLVAGTSTSNAAAVTTPTLAAAAQVNATKDTMLYIAVGTAGTLTVAIGPTSGVANTIVNGLAAAIGDLYTIRLPAGWYVAVTTGTTAAWTTTAIVC